MQILTALGIKELYYRLKNIKELNIYKNDILYKEGILEILKNNKQIKVIIIYEKIPGEISFLELINKIKNINNEIKIVFILENKNPELEKILNENNIKNIFYNSEINFKDFIFKIKNIDLSENELLIKEIEKLKQIILEKNQELNKYKSLFDNKKVIINKEIFKKQFNLIKKLFFNKHQINSIKNKTNKILVISEINFYNYKKIKKIIQKKINFKIEYLNLNNLNIKIKKYDNIIFLINSNFDEIKNGIEKINILKQNYSEKKINILFLQDKYNPISIKILKKIFKYKILGEIKVVKNNNYFVSKKTIKNIIEINKKQKLQFKF